MDDFLQNLKKVVCIVLYGPAVSQSDCSKASPYQLRYNKFPYEDGLLSSLTNLNALINALRKEEVHRKQHFLKTFIKVYQKFSGMLGKITFLLSECSLVRKTTMFENSYLYRMNWRKRYFDAFSCFRAQYTFIWRAGEHSYHKL